jgi:hypothetical protein
VSEVTSVNGKAGEVVLEAGDVEAVPASEVGQPDGLATLNASSVLPEAQLPSSVVTGSPGGTTKKSLALVTNGAGNRSEAVQAKINVLAFGAVPGTNCTSAVKEAIAQAGELGITNLELYFPSAASAYVLALETLGKAAAGEGVSVKLSGDHRFSSWLAPAASEEPILTIEGPADLTNQAFTLVDLGIELTAHRRYDKPLFQINYTRNFAYERVAINGNNFTGTIFSHESAYEGSQDNLVVLNGRYVAPFIHTNSKIPANESELQVCDNFVFKRWTGRALGPVIRNSGQQIHNVIAVSLKCEQSVWYPTGATVLTTLTHAVTAGQTEFEAEAEGIKVGDLLMVGHEALGQHVDMLRVTAVAGRKITVATSTPFLYEHAAGAVVQQGGTALTLGDGVLSAVVIAPHVEHFLAGIAIGSTQNVMLINPYSTSAYTIMRCGSDKNTQVISGTLGGSTVANELTAKAADNTSTLGPMEISGQFSDIHTESGHEAEILPSSGTTYTATFKDTKGTWTTRRNINASTETEKDRAYQVTQSNATMFQIQYSGRGYFKDCVSVGDLGNVTGLKSSEISAKLSISPTDSTAVGTLIATGEREGKQVILTLKTGEGHKWQYAGLTQIE